MEDAELYLAHRIKYFTVHYLSIFETKLKKGQAASALATFREQQRRKPLLPSTSQPLLGEDQMDRVSSILIKTLAASIQRRVS